MVIWGAGLLNSRGTVSFSAALAKDAVAHRNTFSADMDEVDRWRKKLALRKHTVILSLAEDHLFVG
jgi:hypothetical protein